MKLEVLTKDQKLGMEAAHNSKSHNELQAAWLVHRDIISDLTDRLAAEQLRRESATDKLKQLEAKWRKEAAADSNKEYLWRVNGCRYAHAEELADIIKGDSNG